MPAEDSVLFVRHLLGALSRPGLVVLAVLGLGWGWLNLTPATAQSDSDIAATIRAQMERAASQLPADVVLVGDSSCMQGIDAEYLGTLLGGRRVESLCTVVYVGARGYAALLDRYFSAGNQAQSAVIVMHPVGLNYNHDPAWEKWENMVTTGAAPPTSTVGSGSLLPLLRARLPAELGELPFPGDYGQYYGTLSDYSNYLQRHHGSAFSPSAGVSAALSVGAGDNWPVALDPDKRRALNDLAVRARAWPVQKIFIFVSPLPAYAASRATPDEYAAVRQAITGIFHEQHVNNVIVLDTLPYERSELFVDLAHPTREGQQVVTQALAAALTDEGAGASPPPLTVSAARWRGLIDLSAYAIDRRSAAPGDTVRVTLAWRRAVPIPIAYTTFVHLLDREGQLIAQHDQPPRNGIRPTTDWWEGETVTDHITLVIPPGVKAGDYVLRVGWYSADGQRLPVQATPASPEDDGLVLGAVHLTLPTP